LVVGTAHGHVQAGMFHAGRLVAVDVLQPDGRLEVPVAGLHDLGTLHKGLQVFTIDTLGDRRSAHIGAYGGVVTLVQAD
jgi:hypothetical protein